MLEHCETPARKHQICNFCLLKYAEARILKGCSEQEGKDQTSNFNDRIIPEHTI